jgi:hypothetical protein
MLANPTVRLMLDSNLTCAAFGISQFKDLPAASAALFLECGATSWQEFVLNRQNQPF